MIALIASFFIDDGIADFIGPVVVIVTTVIYFYDYKKKQVKGRFITEKCKDKDFGSKA